jgi:hypothetical protein
MDAWAPCGLAEKLAYLVYRLLDPPNGKLPVVGVWMLAYGSSQATQVGKG